jgi:D-alanyl-D-alanine carboxypeptidase (penicillin-binding protein 5/6)
MMSSSLANSKKVPSKLDDIKRRAQREVGLSNLRGGLSQGHSNQDLGDLLRNYKHKEAKLLEELDRAWDDPYLKEAEDRYPPDRRIDQQLTKKFQPRNKSTVSGNKASPTPTTQTTQTFFKRAVSRPAEPLKAPFTSCRNWICINSDTLEIIYGNKIYEEREVASVTKIMTCLVTLDFVTQFNVDIDKTHYLVSRKAANLGGTSANLRRDDYVCIRDLLYGLMLPSGNDAAQTLAENIVTHRYILEKHKNCNPNDLSYDEEVPADKNLEVEFYTLMNKKAKELGLHNTNYDSSHGLMNEDNYSCCYDQARLSVEAMKHSLLQEIVRTSSYTAIIERNDRDLELTWRNTNKLLDRRGYRGIKTGITNAAGGCLATAFQHKGLNLVTVVLGSKDQHSRFTDTENIHNWVISNYREIMVIPLEERYSE